MEKMHQLFADGINMINNNKLRMRLDPMISIGGPLKLPLANPHLLLLYLKPLPLPLAVFD
jgi:hypothetical protein